MILLISLIVCTTAVFQHSTWIQPNPLLSTPSVNADLRLVLLNATRNNGDALCLDGSFAGFYIAPGSSSQFVIYFEGGGWCYTPHDCAYRANTSIGSSASWAAQMAAPGVMSSDPKINPMFHSFTRVFVPYCDGCSFTGDRAAPVLIEGRPIYFRGARILQRILEELEFSHGLRSASDLLVSGCSAGGLSTFLHADRIAAFVPNARRVGALPDSGFFLNATDFASNAYEYGAQMADAWTLHNASAGTHQGCVASLHSAACIMAPYVLPFVKTPIFILNSFYDSWQMGNVVGVDSPSFQNCASHGPAGCNASELVAANRFQAQLVAQVMAGVKKTDGYALESCWAHCQMWSNSMWSNFRIAGHTHSVRDAVEKWFSQLNRPKPSIQYRQVDCTVTKQGSQKCNPVCNQ
jgi:hypothetical protein